MSRPHSRRIASSMAKTANHCKSAFFLLLYSLQVLSGFSPCFFFVFTYEIFPLEVKSWIFSWRIWSHRAVGLTRVELPRGCRSAGELWAVKQHLCSPSTITIPPDPFFPFFFSLGAQNSLAQVAPVASKPQPRCELHV